MIARTGIRTLVICIAGGLALGGIAAIATGAKLKAKSKTVQVDSETVSDDVTAKCKKGRKAVSGGFDGEFDLSPTADPLVLPGKSAKQGKKRWSGNAAEAGTDPAGGDFTVHAYCGKAKKLKSKTADVDIDEPSMTPEIGTVSAKCKRGTKLVSGGFDADFDRLDIVGSMADGPLIAIQESQKVGKREWRASGINLGSEEGTLTAQANCRKGKKKLKTKTTTEEFEPGESRGATLTASCSGKQRVVSGGFSFESSADPDAILFFGSHRAGKRNWEVDVVIPGSMSAERDVTAYAYCEKSK